jgi:hypothetical protein
VRDVRPTQQQAPSDADSVRARARVAGDAALRTDPPLHAGLAKEAGSARRPTLGLWYGASAKVRSQCTALWFR